MAYKVHFDDDNLVPYLNGQVSNSPRVSFFYINDDHQLVGLRYDNWKLVFLNSGLRVRATIGGVWRGLSLQPVLRIEGVETYFPHTSLATSTTSFRHV